MAEAQLYFGFSCPTGGDFYVCEGATSEFVGCCLSDPCSNGSGVCQQDDLRPATFNPDKYAELPAQDCTNSNRTQNFYTCTSTNPPFIGCCASNPCANAYPGAEACPIEDLRAANLSSIEANRRRFLSPDGAKSGNSSATSGTATTTNTASPSASPSNESNSQALSTGAIVGISVAAVVVLLAAVAYFMFRCGYIARRKKEQRASGLEPLSSTLGVMSPPAQMSPYHDSFITPMGSPYSDGNWSKDGTAKRYTIYSDHSHGHYRGHSPATNVPSDLGVHVAPPQELDTTPAPPAELDGSHSHATAYGGGDSSPSIGVRGGYEYGPGPMTTQMPGAGLGPNASPPVGSLSGLGGHGVSPRSM